MMSVWHDLGWHIALRLRARQDVHLPFLGIISARTLAIQMPSRRMAAGVPCTACHQQQLE